ncbi:hypothetical protein OC498_04655 [Acinetobacter bohemicus]|uniref:DUF7944 domain-containing protein n=1 Tax=Acinetobacter lwoffii TaxID=28090 RepID=A0A9D2US64_ACILW|nr:MULTISPECIES: hypothetical protein [Acinetobacter]MDM1782550.1 hypothetical protein [Acinetobacter indicus]HJF27936.1 hypothetical protein [Acinetobacter lwoffii]MCO8042102.1 hypothetical protein [Acinetobacter sp. S4400-12]MCU7224196.1 hypothetical protein [Acinetobacter bohemicus]QKQ70270.1 hypothetical protein E5Y90_08510 [Acinetobacter sp. 10FS3-1]
MMKKKSLSGVALCFSALFSHSVLATTDLTTEESNTIIKEDIAAAQVMAEVCPAIIGKNATFDSVIQQLIQTYLGEYSVKGMTYSALQADSEYKSLLKEARDGAKQSSQEEQQTVCQEILDHQG